MTIWQLTDDDVEAVANLIAKGKSLNEVAADLGVSVEMVVCAARKWPALERRRSWFLI